MVKLVQYKPNDFVKLAWKHIPKCISAYNTKVVDDKGLEEYEAKFSLSCTCTSNIFSIRGNLDDEIGAIPPLLSICNTCHKEEVLLDLAIHGYDAELGNGTNYPQRDAIRSTYLCPECDCKDFKVVINLTYQFESIAEFNDIKTDSIPNLFDVAGVELTCVECGTKSYLGDYECA